MSDDKTLTSWYRPHQNFRELSSIF